ncbi:DUF2500 domain-containing protein [uncultured Eubacterium sp.]|uniref:DUF2500 domain-containing protein n=1 Tax=uncultured Eubacterium sp. TaxID=165185 RepID=UPI0026720EE7|nr:DUF2500 domain-containing protein [uncultured Eubacterium sp.]
MLGFNFGLFELMFFIVFFLVIGVFIVNIARSVGRWNQNNNSPRLTVDASVVSKRTDVSYHHHANAGEMAGNYGYHTTMYYVTFQVDSGDRIELNLNGNEYGMLIEGDKGKLSFQGTRYLGFMRE